MGLLRYSKLHVSNPYYIEDKLLMRNIIDNKQCFYTLVLPQVLITQILKTAYDELGHNGTTRICMLVHRLYYWKEKCMCGKIYSIAFSTTRLQMQFISMDLIDPFDPSSNGHHYTLTVICMLTGYTFCIPLKTKAASEVVQACIDEEYAKFRGSMKILSDNGTEFKNQFFMDVATQLGVECRVYSPPYHPQSNRRIKGFHNFLKACMSKHVSKSLEWDKVIPLACTAYNFLPNEHSKESPFSLMFGRDSIVLLKLLLTLTVRYLGTNENIFSLQALKNMYQLIASNLEQAHKKKDTKAPIPDRKLSEGDSVFFKDHTTSLLGLRYTGDY